MNPPQTTYKPTRSSWLLLLLVAAPIGAVGFAALFEGNLLEGAGAFGFAALLVAYNATMRLCVDDQSLTFRRYGRTVWSVPLDGSKLEDGKGGEPAFLPAHIVTSEGKRVGFLLKGWFAQTSIDAVRSQLRT